MTQHEFPLVADTVTDIILYPTSDELRRSPDDPLVLAKARRAVTLYSVNGSLKLTQVGGEPATWN